MCLRVSVTLTGKLTWKPTPALHPCRCHDRQDVGKIIDAFEKHCIGEANITYERYLFHQCVQRLATSNNWQLSIMSRSACSISLLLLARASHAYSPIPSQEVSQSGSKQGYADPPTEGQKLHEQHSLSTVLRGVQPSWLRQLAHLCYHSSICQFDSYRILILHRAGALHSVNVLLLCSTSV